MTHEHSIAKASIASIYAHTTILRPNKLNCSGYMSTFLSRLNSSSCEIDIRSIKDLRIERISSRQSLQYLLYTIGESLETLQFSVLTWDRQLYDMEHLDQESVYFYDLSPNPHLRVFEILPESEIFTDSILPIRRTLSTLPANHALEKLILLVPIPRGRGWIGEDSVIERDLSSWAALTAAIMRLGAKVQVKLIISSPYWVGQEDIVMVERELKPLKGHLKLEWQARVGEYGA
ncbi:hypothetical protein BDQ12DRAFT_683436 [Crucibulum laeve]|uniref:Uncharacterized protein n=1 Tax=Crucibulum laeve TaxID=68775 RepID=A0A5C3M1G6_9AGAR|nr:hypothetical protein BDQ12DRAFT_683436 [Crucibulum laeve]